MDGFTERTVKNRLSILVLKIGVAHCTQAAIYAIRHGIAPLESAISVRLNSAPECPHLAFGQPFIELKPRRVAHSAPHAPRRTS